MSQRPTRAKLTRVGLVAALVPLAFMIGFIVATAIQSDASPLMLAAIGLAGAAVPFTVMIFRAGARRER